MSGMFVFADTPGQIFSAGGAFLIGIAFVFFQKNVFHVNQFNALIYFLWHSFFCLIYFAWSIGDIADSKVYYLNSLNINRVFNFGTVAVVYLTALFSAGLNMSYGGVFLVYNLFGFVGMVALASALRELLVGAARWVRFLSHLVLLLPSLSFWSSAIGKDSLALMGAGIACWSALDLGRRYVGMVIAVAVFVIVRPHIAGILVICLALTMVVLWKTSFLKKFALVVTVAPIVFYSITFALQSIGLGSVSSIIEILDYIEARQTYNTGGGSSVDIASMSMVMRFFTYAFRPLFVEPLGMLGLAASAENAFLLLLTGWFAWRLIFVRSLLSSFPRAFFFCFVATSLFVLANTTANLGLAMRQKWMFMPMFIMLVFSYIGRGVGGRPINHEGG